MSTVPVDSLKVAQKEFMRQNWLSNRIFKSFDDIVDHRCYAWNTLIDQPWKIMSIVRREWASVGYSMLRPHPPIRPCPTSKCSADFCEPAVENKAVPYPRAVQLRKSG